MKINLERQVICDLIANNGKHYSQIPFDQSDFEDAAYRKMFLAISEDIKDFGRTSPTSINNRIKNNAFNLTQMYQEGMQSDCRETINHHIKLLCREVIAERTNVVKRKAIAMVAENDDIFKIANYVQKEIDAIEACYGDSAFKNDLLTGIDEVEQQIKAGASEAIYTGFEPFDMLNYGIAPEEYIFVAARPSIGKTAFALQLLSMLSEQGIKTGFFSLEMSARAIIGRLLSSQTLQDSRLAARDPARLTEVQKNSFLEAMNPVRAISRNILTSEKAIRNVKDIFPIAKQMQKEGAKAIFVDYIQLLSAGNKQSREQDVSEISRGFKQFAKDTKLPVVVLAQLSRSCEKETRYPACSDLRESGSLEQDADCIYFLAHNIPQNQKEEPNLNHIMLIKAKGRNTGIGMRELFFNKKTQTFKEMEK